jgi:hypothetical protein
MGAILLAVTGLDPKPWEERFRALAPRRDIRVWPERVGESGEVAYACAWHAPHGLLARFLHLKMVFSLGAGVDHIVADPHLPDVPVLRIVDADLTIRMTEYVVLHVLMQQARLLGLWQKTQQNGPAGNIRGNAREARWARSAARPVSDGGRCAPAHRRPRLGRRAALKCGPWSPRRLLLDCLAWLAKAGPGLKKWALRGLCRSARTRLIAPVAPPTGSSRRTRPARAVSARRRRIGGEDGRPDGRRSRKVRFARH